MDSQSLSLALETYISFTKKNDYNSIVNYLYSGLFKLVPKNVLLKLMKESFENDPVSNYIDTFSIHRISEIFQIDKKFFSKVEYYLELKIDRNEDVLAKIMNDESIDYIEHDVEMQSQIDFMLKLLKAKYGEDCVKYNKQEDEFRIWQLNTMLAIYEENEWKFVRWMTGNMYKRIFPERTVKKLATRFYLLD
jgi:hypothetical protein